MAKHRLFTSESVTEGHPDKICDQISDAILDEILTHDPDARVACETCASTGLVHIMGEITTNCYVDFQKIVREVVADIGYTRAKFGFDADTCAVMLELVQGEGGVVALDADYVARVAAFCREKDILLIVDEVQTGVGRTGRFLACEHFGLKPDIVTLAKGLGGGLPIGAVVMNQKVAAHMGPGSHGSTFGGNPVCCAGALAVLDTMDEAFLAQVRERAAQLRAGLAALPHVQQVSGLGLMVGIELADGIKAAEVRAACEREGLLVLTAGPGMRLLPPLVISQEEMDQGLEILKKTLS